MVLSSDTADRAVLGQRGRRGRVITNRVAMMSSATKNPAIENAANTGLTWALWALVRSGTVDGGTGRWLPMEGSVVEVVVGGTTVVTGVGAKGNVAGALDTGCGRVAGGAVGGEVGRVVRGTVGRNAVVGGGTVVEGSVVRGAEVAVWGAVVSIEEVAVVRRLSTTPRPGMRSGEDRR